MTLPQTEFGWLQAIADCKTAADIERTLIAMKGPKSEKLVGDFREIYRNLISEGLSEAEAVAVVVAGFMPKVEDGQHR